MESSESDSGNIAIASAVIVAVIVAIGVLCWTFWRTCFHYCIGEDSQSSTRRPWELPPPAATPSSWGTRQTTAYVGEDRYFIQTQPSPHTTSRPTYQPRPRNDPVYRVENETTVNNHTIVHTPSVLPKHLVQYQYRIENEITFNNRTTVRVPRVVEQETRPKPAIEAVHHQIKDETPDEKYEYQRRRAGEYAKKKNECFRRSKQAYHQRRRVEAKQLSNEGRKFEDKMIACNARAAEIIFEKNNPSGNSTDFIDLHGLFVKEAIAKLNQRIILVKRFGFPHLTVVVGLGKHSQGEPKLKPAVMQYAKDSNIRYKVDSPNRGCIRLYFDEDLDEDSSC